MRSVPSTKYQMTCITSMDVVTPKTRLSKAHTGYRTPFLLLASQVLRGPGSLPQVALFPSYDVLSTVHTLHAHSRFACVSSAPKGLLVSLTTASSVYPSRLRSQMEPLSPSQGTFVPGQKGEESEGRGGACGLGLGNPPTLFSCGKPQVKLGCEVRPLWCH